MKKARLNSSRKVEKNTKEELVPNQTISAKGVGITLVTIGIIFVSFYFLTGHILKNIPKQSILGNYTIDKSNYIAFNELLNQDDSTYYVFAQLEDDKHEEIYENYFSMSPVTPLYYIDMSDAFNKNHIAKEEKIGEVVKDITIKDTTLFAIKDGAIESYYVGYDAIVEYLISAMEKNL